MGVEKTKSYDRLMKDIQSLPGIRKRVDSFIHALETDPNPLDLSGYGTLKLDLPKGMVPKKCRYGKYRLIFCVLGSEKALKEGETRMVLVSFGHRSSCYGKHLEQFVQLCKEYARCMPK